MNRVAELSRCRAEAGLSEEDSLIWFGVGRATIERIEAGEVEPEPEILERIDRFLQFVGGTASMPATSCGLEPLARSLPGPALTHGAGPHGGGARNGPAVNLGGQP